MDVAAIVEGPAPTAPASPRPPQVLLVEDNSGDARLVREALREGLVRAELAVVTGGHAALAYLRRTGVHHAAPRPDLILLDLDLPQGDGFALLDAVKGDPAFRRIPVVVLTGSGDQANVRRSYDRRANCYVAKPNDLDQLFSTVAAIEAFWLAAVTLPAR